MPNEGYEVLANLLNATLSTSTNSISDIDDLHSITEDLRKKNQARSTEGGNIPQPEITPNETTATFNQYSLL